MTTLSPSFDDTVDFENASRGFIAALEPCIIKDSTGRVVWNNDAFDFLQNTKCPETANPGLWRQGQLVSKQGLFKVTEGIYQIRGFDTSNMTMVEGDSGVVIIDPLTSVEVAEAGLALYRAHRGDRNVTGLIYTHSHVDHFGGARGVLHRADKDVPIIAPEGFMYHAVSENVEAADSMLRRAAYQYGSRLPKTPDGNIGFGLGMSVSAGTKTLIAPNTDVTWTGQEEVVDGVRIIFQITPGTEAPSEMNFYFPQRRAMCLAENATHNMHNIVTLRGALVRDAQGWSRYLDESIALFAQGSDVSFASHHWPTWGQKEIVRYLSEQRDLYAYLHDQTIRLMNTGMTGSEIAEVMTLPPGLQKSWHVQGFYGSVSHNVKAIYQRYMGWFDGNAVHLWEHPPSRAAPRYVACMGGIEEVIRKAEGFAKENDLRFAATLLGHAVFSDPAHHAAKEALASVLVRLGHGAENGTWRNFYLSGAQELRSKRRFVMRAGQMHGLDEAMTVDQMLTLLAVRLDGPRAAGESFTIDIYLTDLELRYRLTLSNGALTHRGAAVDQHPVEPAGCSFAVSKEQLVKLLATNGTLKGVKVEGDPTLLSKLFTLLAEPQLESDLIRSRL